MISNSTAVRKHSQYYFSFYKFVDMCFMSQNAVFLGDCSGALEQCVFCWFWLGYKCPLDENGWRCCSGFSRICAGFLTMSSSTTWRVLNSPATVVCFSCRSCAACGILVPWPRIERRPAGVRVQNPSPFTPREFHPIGLLFYALWKSLARWIHIYNCSAFLVNWLLSSCKAFVNKQCKEIEENNRMGKTRGSSRKLEIPREHFAQGWE